MTARALAAIEGTTPPQQRTAWMPLVIQNKLANTDDDIARNIEQVLRRKYLPYQMLAGTESGAVAVVGSGPSLKKNWKRLKNFKGDIIACNAACQFLLAKGITPKYMMCFDADPLMLEFITPHPGITYLLASRCPPKAFEMLEGCRVSAWHAAGDLHLERLMREAHKEAEPMVIGGTAAITRCMVLAQTLGYKTIHLFGADSSFADGETHIRQSTTVERRMFIMVGGRKFETAPWMALQIEDFKVLAPPLRDIYGVKFIVHGDGLLPQIAASMGFEVDWPLTLLHAFRIFKWQLKTLWHNL